MFPPWLKSSTIVLVPKRQPKLLLAIGSYYSHFEEFWETHQKSHIFYHINQLSLKNLENFIDFSLQVKLYPLSSPFYKAEHKKEGIAIQVQFLYHTHSLLRSNSPIEQRMRCWSEALCSSGTWGSPLKPWFLVWTFSSWQRQEAVQSDFWQENIFFLMCN